MKLVKIGGSLIFVSSSQQGSNKFNEHHMIGLKLSDSKVLLIEVSGTLFALLYERTNSI